MKPLRVVALLVIAAACNNAPYGTATPQPAPPPVTHQALRDGMRQLWTEHVFWTRVYLIDALANLPDKQAALDRLMKNQDDIGNALRPYYGDDAAGRLTALLHQHIAQAGALVAAAAANDTAKVNDLTVQWRGNADEIADFLANANPYFPRADLHAMMQKHLDTTLAEATARLKGDYAADVAAYDGVVQHIIMMADALTDGLAAQFPGSVTHDASITDATENLHLAMRALWEDHVSWTRVFIISDAAKLPDHAAATDRLLRNQVDLGNAVKPFYGEAAGSQLTSLLEQHILGAADVLHAAEAGDMAALNDASAKWYQNADQIAGFLAQANPNLKFDDLRSMMHTHLDTTIDEVTKRLQGNYDAEARAYDGVEQHIIMMSDALSAAVVKQFPASFGTP